MDGQVILISIFYGGRLSQEFNLDDLRKGREAEQNFNRSKIFEPAWSDWFQKLFKSVKTGKNLPIC
jgi:hypothetical protein